MDNSEKNVFGYLEFYEEEIEESGIKIVFFELWNVSNEKFAEIVYLIINRGRDTEGAILFSSSIDDTQIGLSTMEEGIKETLLYLMLGNQITWILVNPSLCVNDEMCSIYQKSLDAEVFEFDRIRYLYSEYIEDEYLISTIGSSYIE